MTSDGDRRFIRLNSLWAGANETPEVLLQPDERAVFTMEEYVLTGLGDAFDLLHPDGDTVATAAWVVITDCQTLMPGDHSSDDWQHTLWPTPGEAEPDPTEFATKDDIRFTRFMPSASTDISSNMEFIEVANQGDKLAVLNGWTLRTTTGSSSTYNATIANLMIQPESSVLLANDADAVGVYEDGTVADMDGVLDRNFYLPNSGAALQLLDGSGAEVDTLVYGNGPVSVSGWSGIALAEPLANLDNLIYLRGSGCGDTPDTNTVEDWHEQWSRLGGGCCVADDGLRRGHAPAVGCIGGCYGRDVTACFVFVKDEMVEHHVGHAFVVHQNAPVAISCITRCWLRGGLPVS